MKDKIILAFKAKYPGINLSKSRLAAIATKIETKVIDDETKIDAALAAMDDAYPFADMAKLDDSQRTLDAKLKEKPAVDPKKPEEPAEPVIDADTPPWVKALIESNKALAADITAIKGEKVATTIKGKATELLKDVPVSYWGKRSLPETEEGLEAFATEVNADYTQFKQELTDQGLSVLSTPKAAGGAAATSTEISPIIKAYVQKNAPAAEAAK